MNKKLVWLSAVIVILLLFLGGWWFFRASSPFQSQKPISFKLGWHGPVAGGMDKAIQAYQQELISRHEDAEISITKLLDGTLGELSEVVDQTRSGQAYLTFVTMEEAARFSPKAAVLTTPLLIGNEESLNQLMASPASEMLIQDFEEKSGLKVLGWISAPPKILWVGDERKAPEGLAGLKIAMRGAGYRDLAWQQRGVLAQKLPQGMWRSEAQRGALNGVEETSEWVGSTGLYWHYPQRVVLPGVQPMFFTMNREVYESLSDKQKQALTESTKVWQSQYWNGETIDKINFDLISKQANLHTFTGLAKDFSSLATTVIGQLSKEQQEYLQTVREAVGRFLYEGEAPPQPVVAPLTPAESPTVSPSNAEKVPITPAVPTSTGQPLKKL